jgi:WD40 repeat protein
MDRPLVSYAPEGDRIAVAWTNSQRVSILNGENGVLIDTIDTQSEVRSMVLGPNGLLAVAAGGSIRMWDIDSGRALPGITPHQGMIFTMNFSPDGGLLALGGSGNAVEIWDPASTTLLGANRASEWVMEVRFSPDGRTLAAAGTQVSLWSLVEPIGFTRMAASEAGITSMSFAPNGTLALSFFDGRPITLWNPKVCPSKAIRTEVGPGLAAAFDSEGRLGLISDDAISWVDASCNLLARLPFPGTRDSQRLTRPISPPRQASQAPSSPTAPLTGPPVEAIATDSGEPRTTTAAPPRAPSATKSSTPSKTGGRRGGPWLQLARAPDGRSLLIGRFGRFSLWTDSEPDKIRPVSLEGPGFVRGLAISSSRDRIYLAETERPLAAYAVDSELYVKDLRWAPLTGVLCLAVSHDGRTLAVGLQNGRVALVDTARGRIRHEFLIEDEETAERTITSLAFAPGDHELAVGLREGSVRLWHVSADPAKTPTPLVKLPSQSVLYTHLLFDADGGQLAVGGEKGVDVWKLDEIRGRLESLGMTW